MNELEKKALFKHFKKYKVKITDIDLDNIIKLYNYLLNVICEDTGVKEELKYSFLHKRRMFYGDIERWYFNLFFDALNIYRADLVNFMDYSLLQAFFDRFCCYNIDDLDKVLTMMILNGNIKDKTDYLFEITDPFYDVLNTVLDRSIERINETEYVSDEYKAIMNKFNDIRNIYNEKYIEYDKDKNFEVFINMLYYYVIIHDLLNKDSNNLLNYLIKIDNDIPFIIDKLSFTNKKDVREMIDYIDELYNSKNNKMIIIK